MGQQTSAHFRQRFRSCTSDNGRLGIARWDFAAEIRKQITPILFNCILLGILGGTAACSQFKNDDDGNDEAAAPKQRVDREGRVVLTKSERHALGLEVAAVHNGTLRRRSLRYGTVVARPQEDVLVVAPVTGRFVTSVATLGASVEEGDALAVIEPLVDTASRASLEAERRQLAGQIESAQAQVEAKRTDLKRLSTLVSTNLATEADKAQADAALRSEQARVQSLKRASGGLGKAIKGTLTLRAPAAGTVASLVTSPGTLVHQGDILTRIVRAGPRWVDAAVPPDDPVGDNYRIRRGTGGLTAHLLSRGAVVEPDGTRRDRLQVNSDAAPNLLPGETVSVEVIHNWHGMIVPVEAVVRLGDRKLVFVEVKEGLFAPHEVNVGAREGAQAAVTAGLQEGDSVVTRGASSLAAELGTPSDKTGERRK